MNLYDKSSLILVPSGVKASKVYSQRPENGDGDFTFSRASVANRINENGVLEQVASNVPRLDYSDSSCPSLLLEPQRTNLLLQSNSFDTTWLNSNTTETGGQSGIYGSSDSWLLNKSAANGMIYQSVSSSGTQTISVYAKQGTKSWMQIYAVGSSNVRAYYDLENGVLGDYQLNAIDRSIENVGNGWYRCSVTFNSSLTIIRFYVSDGNNDDSGTSGNIYIQHAQLESGTYPTSVIETTTTQVTRNNDVCATITTAGDNGLINDYQTSIFIDLAEIISNSNVIRFVTLSALGGAQNPRVLLYANSSHVRVQYRVSGQSDIYIDSLYTRSNQNKFVMRLNDNKVALFHNGSKVGEETIVKGNDIENLLLAEGSSTDSGYRVNKLLSFPTALTDEEAIALTTL